MLLAQNNFSFFSLKLLLFLPDKFFNSQKLDEVSMNEASCKITESARVTNFESVFLSNQAYW